MNPTITESLPVIALVVVGFCLKKVNVLKVEDGPMFSRIIMNITLPAVIFLSIAQAKIESSELLILAASGFIVAIVLRMVGGTASRLLKLDKPVAGVVILSCMVMNIGSLMYPVMNAVYGAAAISRTAAFDIGNSTMASVYGYYIASRYGAKETNGIWSSIKRVFSVPVLWAILLALVVNLANLTIPAFFTKLLTPIGQANTLLAMLALGLYIEFKFPKWKLMGMTVFIRMGLGFLVGQLIVLLFHMQGMDRTVVSLASVMPIGLIPLVYASTEGLDAEFAAACISLSIILGLILTPVLLTVFQVG